MSNSSDASLPLDTWHTARTYDVTVVGGGIAGLAFLLNLPPHLRVALLTKGTLGESNTRYAQGGLAAAVGPQDDPDLHFADTIASGAGLCDEDAVRTLVEGGPAAVDWLLAQGTRFDTQDGVLALGLEAAHSRHRVLHAGGDATGAEIERSLVRQVIDHPNIDIFQHAVAIDLWRPDANGPVSGVIAALHGDADTTLFASPVTVVANGGAGQLWAVSSNPEGATGDGIAMALRAGVAVADLEFTQFHPTVFTAPGAEPFLITEAIRGEGAWLRGADGQRFMPALHPLAELAPRDVVARAVQDRMRQDDRAHVWLDLRHLDADHVRSRFPTIAAHLARFGLDLTRDLIPVAPAAHYYIGGIVADSDGHTGDPGLLAIGEVSCTGVHGANRLASNSLLEGLVFGIRAARRLAFTTLDAVTVPDAPTRHPATADDGMRTEARRAIQRTMSADVAVVRSEASLTRAATALDAVEGPSAHVVTRQAVEVRNMLLLARQIVRSAALREESRGGHFRSDYPATDPDLAGLHQIVTPDESAPARVFAALAAALPETVEYPIG